MAVIHHDKRPPVNNDTWTGCSQSLNFTAKSLSGCFKAFFIHLFSFCFFKFHEGISFARMDIFVSSHTPLFSPFCIAFGYLKVAHWYPIIWASLFYFRQALPFTGRLSALQQFLFYLLIHKSDSAAFFGESLEIFHLQIFQNVHPDCTTVPVFRSTQQLFVRGICYDDRVWNHFVSSTRTR